MLDNIPTAVACCNLDDDSAAIYCNEEFVRSFGYTPADVPTIDRWYDLTCPDEQQRAVRYQSYEANLGQLRREPGKVERREFGILCKDGRTTDVVAGAVVIDGLLLFSFVDITDRKRYENELKQARDELAAANAEHKRLAITDSLTGISNRRHFEEETTQEMVRACGYCPLFHLDRHFARSRACKALRSGCNWLRRAAMRSLSSASERAVVWPKIGVLRRLLLTYCSGGPP